MDQKLIDAVVLKDRIRSWARVQDRADLSTVLDIMEIVEETPACKAIPCSDGRKSDIINSEGLKSCPFCGSTDVYLEDDADGGDEYWFIGCKKCFIGFNAGGGEDGCCDATKEEVIAAWNRRA